MTYKTVYTDVEVDIGEFDDDDLIDELESRGYEVVDNRKGEPPSDVDSSLLNIYYCIKLNKSYDKLLADLIYDRTGRV